MTQPPRGPRVHERWAHLRFSVIGQLLAAPPDKGELRAEIEALSQRTWRHPSTGEPVRFGFSTIERWYYRALKERTDPVGVPRRKLRADAGQQIAVSDPVRQAVLAQYAAHKSWSVQLHHDNLAALAETMPELKPVPSYATLRRFMQANGLGKRRRLTSRRTDGAERAEARLADRENVMARLYPRDKTLNASGLRRTLDPLSNGATEPAPAAPASPIPPLLQRLLDQQSSTGLPPPYLPKDDANDDAKDVEGDDT